MTKLAIVTGGARGIGRAIVEILLANNYLVYFTYHHSKDAAQALMDQHPDKCKGFQIDSGNEGEISTFANEVLKNKSPYALINNTGINNDQLFMLQGLKEFWDSLHINLGSTLRFCKAFLPSMIENKIGHIINISSVAATRPRVGNSAYGVSKAAIERFSQTLALEVARFNIHVNCIAPGFVQTEMFETFMQSQDKRQFYSHIPMKKVLLPEEIGKMVCAICEGIVSTTGTIFKVGNGENII